MLGTILEQRTSRVIALDEGPGEGVGLGSVVEAEVKTHALNGGVEVSSSGVA